MSQSAKKKAFDRVKTSSRLSVLTTGQRTPSGVQLLELELPQPKRGPDRSSDLILLQLVKNKLKETQGSDFP